jgi:hypothetical protein
MKPSLSLLAVSLGTFVAAAAMSPQKNSQQAGDEINFGRDVRPILSQHCFKCHGPDVAQAASGLRLDIFAGATKKLGDGFAIVPQHPEESLLLKRVSEKQPEDRMPPPDSGAKPLTPAEIEILRKWIGAGARYEKHWAYVAPAMPNLPEVQDRAWCRNSIDRFVLAKLEAAGLKPEPEADRDTLALRAAETLTGLPPTKSLLDQYRSDLKPGAYERFVDKLLAEPTYGEQQARYWMDAVRYGDTHGLQLDNERSVYPYRDWVVREFNRDLPFDKFAKWQLAGDLLPNPTNEQLVATGYVRMNLTSNEGGAIPEEFLARNTFDRVDTTGTVFLGLTVGCAKCHDHKYDPISQKDYYGLYAFFDSTQDKPLDDNIALPEPVAPAPSEEDERELKNLDHQLATLASQVDLAFARRWLRANARSAITVADWQISDVYPAANFDAAFDQVDAPEPGAAGDAHWKTSKFQTNKDKVGLIGRDNASVYVRTKLSVQSPVTTNLGVSSDDGVKVWLNGKLIHSHKVSRGLPEGIDQVKAEFKEGDNQLLVKLINGGEPDGLNVRFNDEATGRIQEALRIYAKSPNSQEAENQLRREFLADGPSSLDSLVYRAAMKKKSEVEAAIPMTLIAREMATPRPTFVLKRGQYDQKGDPVTRHIPAVLGSLPANGKVNRLSFAEWLTSPSNPLFARVYVNRVWQQVFGTGVVKTVDDFGSQGEWPANQPLLDYLAVKFERDGWSVKQLNRLIVTSAAFRQSSKITPLKLAKDPENRLISRGPRFRLDAEEIRDKALMAGGLLVEKLGGRGFKPYQPDGLWEGSSDPASSTHVYVRDHDLSIYRRSLYLFWKRTSPPPAMITFDAPLRDSCIVKRSRTNTPLQALTTLNETSFLEASRTMAQRLLNQPEPDKKRIDDAFQITLQRDPKPAEMAILQRALGRYRSRYASDPVSAQHLIKIGDAPQKSAAPVTEQAAWMLVCSSLMNTDEFLSLH